MVALKRTFCYYMIVFGFLAGACKSDKQEVISDTASDTTMVVQPLPKALNSEEETDVEKQYEKQKAKTKKSGNIANTAPAEEQGANTLEAEDINAITQQDMEYNEFPAKPAAYPGGSAALNQYLAQHIRYPAQARENKIEGTVYANILVDEAGALGDVSFIKPIGYGLEEEVLKAIRGMPNLIPAEDQGKPVKTKFILPVKFYLK